MHHRGPEDEGYVFFNIQNPPLKDESYWVEKGSELPETTNQEEWNALFKWGGDFNLALGHRRLSIIDLSPDAHQPMSNRANGIWVTYNGEIYNYKELRSELQSKGHRFFSQSDTEVIIHLYEAYGEDALRLLNGIFAFALWDGRNNRLLIARDRYGAKPIYYTMKNDTLCFASEIKALLQVDGITAKLNNRALVDYFTFQNTYGETTLFDDIHLLKPGHFLVVENGKIRKNQYWDFEFIDEQDKGEAHYIDQIKSIFPQVINRQMISDVPVGSYLSGGMDSGSITAYASKNIPRLMTFTGGFDVATAVSIENFFDERDKAELMSRAFNTEHYQMVIHAGDLEWALPRVIWHTEDLRVGMSYPHYYLSRLAGKFVKVVLAGAGGDEILAGYPWRYSLLETCNTDRSFEKILYKYWSRLINDENRTRFFNAEFFSKVKDHSPLESIREVLSGNTNSGSYIKKALYFDAKTFLHGILVIEDKLSMAHSLESRVPFLDNEFVDFAVKIPTKYLLNASWIPDATKDITLSGKYIFRRAMEDYLPQEIIKNRKQGFSAPDQTWYMQKLVRYIKSIILSERALSRGYFNPVFLESILDEHIKGKQNHRLLIWSLLSFEWWNRLFIDGESYPLS